MDPVYAAGRHYAWQEKELQRSPICAECGEHITDEYCYEIEDDLVCESCLRMNHGRVTTDYMED